MSHYTPTTNEVRTAFAVDEFGYWFEDGQGAEFDRWMTAHDAEVTAKAVAIEREATSAFLERVANDATHPMIGEGGEWHRVVSDTELRAIAQSIRNGEHVKP